MSTEENNQAPVTEETTGEGEGESSQEEVVTLKKGEYDKMLTDLGSLKRENKDLKKPKEPKETPQKTDDSELSQKVEALSMQVAGITKDSEVELAKNLQKETGLPMDKLLSSKYFKSELEDLRTSEANAEASTGIKGDKTGSSAKQSAEYWIAKGEYPTREQVPDAKVRTEIRKAMVAKEKGTSGKFYNS